MQNFLKCTRSESLRSSKPKPENIATSYDGQTKTIKCGLFKEN